MPTSYRRSKKKGCLALGYKSEHFRIAGQMAVAIIAAMLFVVIDPVYKFLGEYAVWIVVTVVVAFSPNVGSALNSAVIGIVGSILGGALGIMIIALISALAMGFDYEQHSVTMSVWACALMGLVGFVLELNKERFRRLEYGCSVALLTFPIVAIPGFRAVDEAYVNRLKLSLCGCIGVMLTVLAAAVVFPVRARSRLRKSTARILEDLGSLAFQLLGEFCQEPDEGMHMRGSTGTDAAQHYVDDGLQQSLDGLHRAQLALQKDVADMAALIGPARSETRYLKCKKPRFPISTYKAINRLCARILTALGSLHHSMESGHLRLGLCVVYRPLLEELRQDVAASLTALSGLVLGTLSEEYARQKMERLCAAAVELQSALAGVPMKAGYNMHVETLAIAAKTATNLARQVASMYMDLRPEVAHQIHSSLCGGSDALPGHKSPPPGGPPPDGGGAGGGSAQLRAQENVPQNGKQLGIQPLGAPQTGHDGSPAVEAKNHVGPHGLDWDIEQGLAGILPGSSRPPSGLNGKRLSSILESESSDYRSQTLSDLQGQGSAKNMGTFLRSKSLPGPVLIPGSVFRNALQQFNMPLHPQPTYPEEPPATPPAPPSPADRGDHHHPFSGGAPRGDHPLSSGGSWDPQKFPPRPSGSQGLRNMLQSAGSGSSPRKTSAVAVPADWPGQRVQPPDWGGSAASATSASRQQPHQMGVGSGEACELSRMTTLQRKDSPSAWLHSRSTSFRAEDNPFG